MDMLKIPKEKRCFQEILLAIKHLKKSIQKNIGTEIDLKEAIRTLDENPKKTKESFWQQAFGRRRGRITCADRLFEKDCGKGRLPQLVDTVHVNSMDVLSN